MSFLRFILSIFISITFFTFAFPQVDLTNIENGKKTEEKKEKKGKEQKQQVNKKDLKKQKTTKKTKKNSNTDIKKDKSNKEGKKKTLKKSNKNRYIFKSNERSVYKFDEKGNPVIKKDLIKKSTQPVAETDLSLGIENKFLDVSRFLEANSTKK